jgi:hypothetical protein
VETDPEEGEGEGSQVVHCDRINAVGRCTTYTGTGWDKPSTDADCGETTIVGACPTSDLGGCRTKPQQALEFVEWYYTGTYWLSEDAEFLEADCVNNGGSWISVTGEES